MTPRATALCWMMPLALLLGGAASSGVAGVTLDGAVLHPGALDPASLASLPRVSLPRVSLPVVQATGHGVSHERPVGVLLWDLLQQAKPQDEAGKHAALRHTVEVTGKDGYRVDFSFGELDPAGSADPVLLVTAPEGVQLMVPHDHTAARDVHDVTRITVR